MTEIKQDTINYTLETEIVVTNDTVKITAMVTALVGINAASAESASPDIVDPLSAVAIRRDLDIIEGAASSEEDALRQEIRTVLKAFIDAEWKYSNISRTTTNTGIEQISLIATTRVSEKENYALDERAARNSRKGLQIHSVVVDSSIPSSQINDAQRQLRAKLIREAMDEARELTTMTGRTHRVGDITFNANSNSSNKPRFSLTTNNAMNEKAMGGYGSGFDEQGDLSTSQKITMSAAVTLVAENG